MSHKEQEAGAMQETQFGCVEAPQKRVIYFTNGETLDLDSDEEEEEEEEKAVGYFGDNRRKGRFSLKNLVLRVGRLSLLTCDFLGERLAGALGLNEAKYQYAIDQHQRQKKIVDDAGTTPLSPSEVCRYGATEGTRQVHSDAQLDKGRLNWGYHVEEDN
ncbi:unnamed protein product [Knipowitschia caucasica]